MKTIVITRKYWGRSALRINPPGTNEGKCTDKDTKCCLGFVCEAYGMKPKQTFEREMPRNISAGTSKLPKWLLQTNHEHDDTDVTDVRKASLINDDQDLTDAQKEEQLIPIFKKHGIRLVFRGKR